VRSSGDRLRSFPGSVSLIFHEHKHGKVDTYPGGVLTSETVDVLYARSLGIANLNPEGGYC
jgi:hypothetical protein